MGVVWSVHSLQISVRGMQRHDRRRSLLTPSVRGEEGGTSTPPAIKPQKALEILGLYTVFVLTVTV